MKFSLLYLGCRVNQAEIGQMDSTLRLGGHEVVELHQSPDVCIINTCTVTKKSDEQSRQLIRKATRTGARVIVTGCYAALNADDIRNIQGVDIIADNSEKPNIINQFIAISSTKTSDIGLPVKSRSKYFLKVQDGCDNSCTYCRVWQARGKSRSVNPNDAIVMAQEAERAGYSEIVLTGIHLGTYGRDLDGYGEGIAGLLEYILKGTKHCRIRLSSLEVNEIDDRLIDLIGDERVCRHLHVPLQSGDAGVLSDMAREYSADDFAHKINMIYSKLPGIGLGTDVIAGFPTESEAAFNNTASLIRELPFTYLHVFPYSNRPGTIASGLPDMVQQNERISRAATLRLIGQDKKDEYAKAQIGSTLEVLLESVGDDGTFRGTSDNYVKVTACLSSLSSEGAARELGGIKGKLASVVIHSAKAGRVQGNILKIKENSSDVTLQADA